MAIYPRGTKLRLQKRFAGDQTDTRIYTVERIVYANPIADGGDDNRHDGIILRAPVDHGCPFLLYSREGADAEFTKVTTKTVKVQQFRLAPVCDPTEWGGWTDRFAKNGTDRCRFSDHLIYQFREISREVTADG